ncbi:MAG TPA: rod shape-determining protein MreC [Terracidiphilus sp.]|jgi:rod shape-determining protein MreC|nr:rod shape-determining protein MreC [Terracidiphilus sp.]
MESFFDRYRNLIVLLAILLVQIMGLAVQVRRTSEGRSTLDPRDSSGVRLIRLWANALVSPPERIIHSTGLGAGHLWQNYLDLRHVRQQNQELQKTIDRLRLEQASLLEDARQGQRLQALNKFQEKYIYKTVAAQAIGSSGSELSHVFYIDKGSDDGVARDNAVITPDGIVGKVREVLGGHSAQVLAVNDQTSGAGVILETTRIRGILRGNAFGQLEIVDILADKRIQKGEVVLTAGGDQIFPRGLPVGTVDKVVPDPERDSFIVVMITPAAHLDRLDEVLVVTSTEPRFSTEQQQDIATSEEVKGSEAAAIKEQQKASQIMAERLPGLIDPKLPPDQQPLYDNSNPIPVAHPPQALHPDRFTPGNAPGPVPDAASETAPDANAAQPDSGAKPTEQKPASKPSTPKQPGQSAPRVQPQSQKNPPGGTN